MNLFEPFYFPIPLIQFALILACLWPIPVNAYCMTLPVRFPLPFFKDGDPSLRNIALSALAAVLSVIQVVFLSAYSTVFLANDAGDIIYLPLLENITSLSAGPPSGLGIAGLNVPDTAYAIHMLLMFALWITTYFVYLIARSRISLALRCAAFSTLAAAALAAASVSYSYTITNNLYLALFQPAAQAPPSRGAIEEVIQP